MFLKDQFTKESIDILPEIGGTSDFKIIYQKHHKLLRDLMVILTTRRTSILYQPEYGGNLYEFMWDSILPETLDDIRELIEQSLDQSEYLNVKNISVTEGAEPKTIKVIINLVTDKDTILEVGLNFSPLGEISIEYASEVISKYIIQGD